MHNAVVEDDPVMVYFHLEAVGSVSVVGTLVLWMSTKVHFQAEAVVETSMVVQVRAQVQFHSLSRHQICSRQQVVNVL